MKKSVFVLSLLLSVTENTIAAEPNVDSAAVDSAALHSFQVKEAARIRMPMPEELQKRCFEIPKTECANYVKIVPWGPYTQKEREKRCQEAQDSGCGEDCFEFCGEPCDRVCLDLKLPKTPEVLELLKRLEKLQLPKTLELPGSKGPITPAERKKLCFEAQKTGCGKDCQEFCGKPCNRACLRLKLPKTSEIRRLPKPRLHPKTLQPHLPITPQPKMSLTPLFMGYSAIILDKLCQEAQEDGCGEDCVKFCGKPCDRVCE